MVVRFAFQSDLPAVNLLRKQLNDLHVAGKPEIFKPGFPAELRDYLYAVFDDPDKELVVAEQDGSILGFAILNALHRPETPYMFERRYLDVDELCVAESARRQGVGRALIDFIRNYAGVRGFSHIELNMWEFNRDALAFYEALGFTTYRRYMELPVEQEEEK